MLTPSDFDELRLEDGRVVRFYAVVPLHADEMELKLERGTEAILGRLDEHGVTEVVDPRRPSVAPRRRRRLF